MALVPWTVAGADLAPEVQVDRLLVQAERQTRDGEHWSAAVTLDHALETYKHHGLEIPRAFWFKQARAYERARMHERAVEAATKYLTMADREAEHYRAALQVLDAAEVALAEAQRARARAQAELQQRQRAAAERRAAIALATPEMVRIPSTSPWDRDSIYIRAAFEISKYEVTFAQWDVCVEYGPCIRVSDNGWGRGDRPVINVSWDDARVFIRWLSEETNETYRLPSNREWTHAALGGSKTRYSWGRGVGENRANCRGCGSQWDNRTTAPVGSFAANAYGLHDMHGNVWEWVQNCWNRTPNNPFEHGHPISAGSSMERTHCDGRMRRGGSYASKPKAVRADRVEMWNKPYRSFNTVGFRVVRTLNP